MAKTSHKQLKSIKIYLNTPTYKEIRVNELKIVSDIFMLNNFLAIGGE